jgi:hypothetical protein
MRREVFFSYGTVLPRTCRNNVTSSSPSARRWPPLTLRSRQ